MEKGQKPLISVIFVFTLILVVGKIFNLIDWDWIWVLSPLWITIALGIVLSIIVFILQKFLDKSSEEHEKKLLEDRKHRDDEPQITVRVTKPQRKEKAAIPLTPVEDDIDIENLCTVRTVQRGELGAPMSKELIKEFVENQKINEENDNSISQDLIKEFIERQKQKDDDAIIVHTIQEGVQIK